MRKIKELRALVELANTEQLRSAIIQLIEDVHTPDNTLELAARVLTRTVLKKKCMISVHGNFIDASKIAGMENTVLWKSRDLIVQHALNMQGSASTHAMIAYLAANYPHLRVLIDDAGVSNTTRRQFSLLLRMHGFVHSVVRRRMADSEFNTTGRSWIQPRERANLTCSELMMSADMILSNAVTTWEKNKPSLNGLEDQLI